MSKNKYPSIFPPQMEAIVFKLSFKSFPQRAQLFHEPELDMKE